MSAVTDERAVSTVMGYTLTLGISSLLIIGLLVATGGFVDDHRHQTVRDELQVLGQQLASDLSAADRLVQSGGTEVSIRRQLPEETTGLSYRITVDPGSPAVIRLSTSSPDVTVEVPVPMTTTVQGSTLDGGPIAIVYDDGTGQLEVKND